MTTKIAPECIRPAVAADAEHVAKLITELGYPTTTRAMTTRLLELLADPSCVTFVADMAGHVIGVAGAALGRYYEKDGSYSRVTVLVVASTARGRGIGTRLVEAIERWSASREARDVIVNSGVHRADAHAFYRRRGYSHTGFRFIKPLDPRR
jgi:GNAT superfamily N-acetyltransferase